MTATAPPEPHRRATGGGSSPRRGYLVVGAVVLALAVGAVIFAEHTPVKTPAVDVTHLPDAGPAPALDAKGWINSPPLTHASLEGKVVLYDFWTYSCINCQRTIPYLRSWFDRYRADGLVIVGIHSPEFDFEKVHKNVETAVNHLGVTWPVALDDNMKIWNAFQNNSWPADYFADRAGHIRYVHVGEGAYKEAENVIRKLLDIRPVRAGSVSNATTLAEQTTNPETYLGLIYQNPQFPLIDIRSGSHDYLAPRSTTIAAPTVEGNLPPGKVSGVLVGKWTASDEAITSDASAATILLGVHAQAVNLVMATKSGKPTDVLVEIDGRPIPASDRGPSVHEDGNGRTVVTVNGASLYYILKSPAVESHLLSVTATAPGLEAYDFTFG